MADERGPGAVDPGQELETLRQQIDEIDVGLVRLLAERSRVVERVASLKRANNLPIYHPAREEDLISLRREQARHEGLDPDMVEELFRRVVRSSRVSQSETLSGHGVRAG